MCVGTSGLAGERFEIAITVDDLPLQGAFTEGPSRLEIAKSYVKTLKAYHVKEAYGFVNGGKLATASDGREVLDYWRSAGYPLGNHGLTHMNLGRAESLAAWIGDMEANEPFIKPRMNGKAWRVLRFPNLSGGGKGERHDGAIAWLKAERYSIAEVTLSFSDWAYTEAYNRCRAKGDAVAIGAMEIQYLAQVDDGIVRMKALSRKVYGRVVPQVLLTHLSAWSAHMLPQVMARLDKAGARFVTLAKAQADPAYLEPESDWGNGPVMERAAKRHALDLSDLPKVKSTPNLDTLCR
ncbi:polysaccharide deacetylase family protein [Asticcacaulis sp. BYS171W]|uniref:Chitooligosaccharide deacetylase n=1 Tax=Asticcacaulis aquaticus TaxID=2984212 RepID=A0ABT5HPY3_9CAUL|nr:polysaccharide deacetylase family protein [Asticcacaulis aquaticus]MDC7682127.1 polysaccharide deacetylase family protein [Asticcacaulis aquaticus]